MLGFHRLKKSVLATKSSFLCAARRFYTARYFRIQNRADCQSAAGCHPAPRLRRSRAVLPARLAELPQDLPQYSQQERSIAACDPEAANPPADLLFRGYGRDAVGVARFFQNVEKLPRDLLGVG